MQIDGDNTLKEEYLGNLWMPLGVNLKSREGNSQTGHRMFTQGHYKVPNEM